MVEVAIQEAKKRLDELVDEASDGEIVLVSRSDGRRFRIVPFEEPTLPLEFGFARGEIEMSDDFDEPLEDFAEYMS